MYYIAVCVGQNLDFYMPRRRHCLLHIDGTIAECSLSFAPCQTQRRLQLLALVDEPNTLTAAASCSFEQNRIPYLFSNLGRLSRILDPGVISGHDRYVCSAGDSLGRRLLTQLAHDVARRPNEDDACQGARVGKIGILGEKAISRMYRSGSGSAGRFDDLFLV